ncbi:MAG: glycosyltransferase family 4 protein [Blastocatellia bacterium]
MRLTILNQFFYPDHSATSQLMTALAEDLAARGVEVTALASRGGYNGGGAFAARERHKGVRIERAWATSFGKRHVLGRLADYATFYFGACFRLMTMPRQEIVMALTTPPLIGLVAMAAGRMRGMRFVALLEDLYPDVAVALGAVPAGGVITRALERLNRLMLRRADRIIVLGDCMLRRVTEKAGEDLAPRIDVIHNWADGREIVPMEGVRGEFLRAVGLERLADKFIVLFGGNLGRVNEFSTVLDAAGELRARDDIAFVFIGEGAKSAEIRRYVEQHRLSNIHLLPYQPREHVCRSLGAADALLVTLADGLAGISVPSKTYSNLAAGRPILFVGDLESCSARLVVENDCGAAVASGASAEMAETLRAWTADRSIPAGIGRRARALFERRFDRPHAVAQYLSTFTRCLGRSEREPGKRIDRMVTDHRRI